MTHDHQADRLIMRHSIVALLCIGAGFVCLAVGEAIHVRPLAACAFLGLAAAASMMALMFFQEQPFAQGRQRRHAGDIIASLAFALIGLFFLTAFVVSLPAENGELPESGPGAVAMMGAVIALLAGCALMAVTVILLVIALCRSAVAAYRELGRSGRRYAKVGVCGFVAFVLLFAVGSYFRMPLISAVGQLALAVVPGTIAIVFAGLSRRRVGVPDGRQRRAVAIMFSLAFGLLSLACVMSFAGALLAASPAWPRWPGDLATLCRKYATGGYFVFFLIGVIWSAAINRRDAKRARMEA
jgi:hypothetical protein